MKEYIVDTDVFIRLLVQNIPQQSKKSERYLRLAKEGKIKVYVISETIPEIEYVLRKVYKISRTQVADKLLSLLKTMYIEVEKRLDWIEAVNKYLNLNVDLVDAFLSVQANKKEMTVLSFDKDFKKIK